MEGPHVEEGSVGPKGNHSRASSWGQKRVEREQRREQDCMQDGHQTKLDLNEGSSQGERIVSYIPEQSYRSERVQKRGTLRK